MNNIFFCDYIYSFCFFLEAERHGEANAKSMAYSSAAPIPLHTEQGQQKSFSDRSGSGQEKRPPQSNKKDFLLPKEGMRLGEELGGLTPNLRV